MHYVYLLKSRKTDRFYIGNTADLKKRFYRHNKGLKNRYQGWSAMGARLLRGIPIENLRPKP